jgi:formate hydrogenlyase subunit 6/NADH:ubiquinone oxidoreductase subunit I
MFGKGKNQRNKSQQRGTGASQFGVCSCPQCNYSVPHKRGVPCTTLRCPKCNIPLVRQAQPVNSNKQQVSSKTTKTSSYPEIDVELCIGCGACVNTCPAKAIHIEDGKAKITITNCKKCKACVNTCPVGAIS